MKRRELMVATGLAVMLGMSFSSLAATPITTQDPEEWVLAVSNDMIATIRSDKALAAEDPERLARFINEKVMPVVDFERMTRSAVGPKWRSATPEQRQTLQELFRDMLTRVYSGGLKTVTNQEVKLAPNRVKNTDTQALVRTVLVAPGKQDIRMDYRLYKTNGQWRIVDMNVEGIWIVDNYRTQFSSVANQKGIDGLIETMRTNNQKPQ